MGIVVEQDRNIDEDGPTDEVCGPIDLRELANHAAQRYAEIAAELKLAKGHARDLERQLERMHAELEQARGDYRAVIHAALRMAPLLAEWLVVAGGVAPADLVRRTREELGS